jgi:hypothetical protein
MGVVKAISYLSLLQNFDLILYTFRSIRVKFVAENFEKIIKWIMFPELQPKYFTWGSKQVSIGILKIYLILVMFGIKICT